MESKPTNPKKVTLNRAVFAGRPHDSTALTCLDTLLHRFNDAGDYVVSVLRGGRVIHRLSVQVSQNHAATQHNIDLATLDSGDCACHSAGTADYTVKPGGILGFYVSSGVANYSISVRNSSASDTAKENSIIFDSSKGVAVGDLFAATLVRPGLYRVRERLSQAEATIQVAMPPAPAKPETKKSSSAKSECETDSPKRVYRPDQPQLLDFGPKGFSKNQLQLYSGQSVIVHCQQIAQLIFVLEKPDDVTLLKPQPFHYQKPLQPTRSSKKS